MVLLNWTPYAVKYYIDCADDVSIREMLLPIFNRWWLIVCKRYKLPFKVINQHVQEANAPFLQSRSLKRISLLLYSVNAVHGIVGKEYENIALTLLKIGLRPDPNEYLSTQSENFVEICCRNHYFEPLLYLCETMTSAEKIYYFQIPCGFMNRLIQIIIDWDNQVAVTDRAYQASIWKQMLLWSGKTNDDIIRMCLLESERNVISPVLS